MNNNIPLFDEYLDTIISKYGEYNFSLNILQIIIKHYTFDNFCKYVSNLPYDFEDFENDPKDRIYWIIINYLSNNNIDIKYLEYMFDDNINHIVHGNYENTYSHISTDLSYLSYYVKRDYLLYSMYIGNIGIITFFYDKYHDECKDEYKNIFLHVSTIEYLHKKQNIPLSEIKNSIIQNNNDNNIDNICHQILTEEYHYSNNKNVMEPLNPKGFNGETLTEVNVEPLNPKGFNGETLTEVNVEPYKKIIQEGLNFIDNFNTNNSI